MANNSTTQALIGKLGGIPPLIALCTKALLEAQEHACCCLWHLASEAAEENRAILYQEGGIPPLVALLVSDGAMAAELAAMTVVRMAEGSARAAVTIAEKGPRGR